MMLDNLIIHLDKTIRDINTVPKSKREHPDFLVQNETLTKEELKHSIGLMRINHCGEVCAQGLYRGQAIFASNDTQKNKLAHAALQEEEHLAWTHQRISDLGGNVSIINPIFYLGSVVIGVAASICGDKWSLGFLEETEHQVGAHLSEHLDKISENDHKSRAVLEQMKIDEAHHAAMAHEFGASDLPWLIKKTMKITSKIMTTVAYRV